MTRIPDCLMAKYDPKKSVSWDEMLMHLGMTENDLDDWEDVEIE